MKHPAPLYPGSMVDASGLLAIGGKRGREDGDVTSQGLRGTSVGDSTGHADQLHQRFWALAAEQVLELPGLPFGPGQQPPVPRARCSGAGVTSKDSWAQQDRLRAGRNHSTAVDTAASSRKQLGDSCRTRGHSHGRRSEELHPALQSRADEAGDL